MYPGFLYTCPDLMATGPTTCYVFLGTSIPTSATRATFRASDGELIDAHYTSRISRMQVVGDLTVAKLQRVTSCYAVIVVRQFSDGTILEPADMSKNLVKTRHTTAGGFARLRTNDAVVKIEPDAVNATAVAIIEEAKCYAADLRKRAKIDYDAAQAEIALAHKRAIEYNEWMTEIMGLDGGRAEPDV